MPWFTFWGIHQGSSSSYLCEFQYVIHVTLAKFANNVMYSLGLAILAFELPVHLYCYFSVAPSLSATPPLWGDLDFFNSQRIQLTVFGYWGHDDCPRIWPRRFTFKPSKRRCGGVDFYEIHVPLRPLKWRQGVGCEAGCHHCDAGHNHKVAHAVSWPVSRNWAVIPTPRGIRHGWSCGNGNPVSGCPNGHREGVEGASQ